MLVDIEAAYLAKSWVQTGLGNRLLNLESAFCPSGLALCYKAGYRLSGLLRKWLSGLESS